MSSKRTNKNISIDILLTLNELMFAQTAYGLQGDREKSIAAGCNDYISKPLKSEELKSMIKKHCFKK